ncbi:MAG TPA: HHL1-like protein [Coleofasciculaceae cyanobacterium]
MPKTSGFGKPQPQPKPSKRSQERAKASTQYEKMKTDGLPEYEVYIRIQDKKQWFPVGVISVQRSSQINAAIFDSQEQLLQGAFRIFPILKKHQTQLEYGYRLKEFKDEPIQLAVQPQPKGTGGLQGAIAQVKDRVSALLKRS